MTKYLAVLLCVACVSIGRVSANDVGTITVKPADEVRRKLVQQYPNTRFGEVRATPIAGIFEVVMGQNIGYVGLDPRYMLFGHLYDLQTNNDLTASAREQLERIDFASLDLSKAITFEPKSGTVRYELAVFSDPNCGYCRQLEQTLAAVPDLRYHVFLTPLLQDSASMAEAVWCSSDARASWQALMLKGVKPTSSKAKCDASAISGNAVLAGNLNVKGTPTLIARSGARQAGALAQNELVAWLDSQSGSRESTPLKPTLKHEVAP
jgi:thiol:disulfide interchange protein DsbC